MGQGLIMNLNEHQNQFKVMFTRLLHHSPMGFDFDTIRDKAFALNEIELSPHLTDFEMNEVLGVLTQELLITFNPSGTVVDHATFKAWIADRKASGLETPRSKAYTELLLQRGWAMPVLGEIDRQSEEIVELMGDPNQPGTWSRRGLIMGAVQSGKTANYIGVLNKAMDFGYQVIIVIGGHTKELRKQTQMRLDTDLFGIDSEYIGDHIASPQLKSVGIGEIDPSLRVHLMTTVRKDFDSQQKIAGVTWIGTGIPTVFVIKKNARIIDNVANYIKQQSTSSKLDMPLVVIDDEADWGTPNTGTETDPTKVNKAIRNLLDSSNKSTYLGITATPFANIFINDEAMDADESQDLFPSDYIRVLSSPSNYFGMSHYFDESLSTDSDSETSVENTEHLRFDVDDCIAILPIKHKSHHRVLELPNSLKQSVMTFMIASAIRNIRDQVTLPSSMLVNVSRFKYPQEQVASLMEAYLGELKGTVVSEFSRTGVTFSSTYIEFMACWERDYDKPGYPNWDEVKAALVELESKFRVELVNSSTSSARAKERRLMSGDQRRAKDKQPTVYVGGDVLSRGLTLEGLVVSYFVREPRTMDTLMQMARWFGYRPGYSDLVRVWLPRDTANDFAWSAAVTVELQDLLLEMQSRELTPKNFGLRIRTHPEGFRIVAANRSRSTGQIYAGPIVWENRLLESFKLFRDAKKMATNRAAVANFIEQIVQSEQTGDIRKKETQGRYVTWENVPLEQVRAFVGAFIAPNTSEFFSSAVGGGPSMVYESLSEAKGSDRWNVSLISGDDPNDYEVTRGIKIYPSIRNTIDFDSAAGEETLHFLNRKVSTASNLASTLGVSELAGIVASRNSETESNSKAGVTQKEVLACLEHPSLMIYHITGTNQNQATAPARRLDITSDEPLVALAIAYPKLSPTEAIDAVSRAKKFTANSVYLRILYGDIDETDDKEIDAIED